jgi:formate hydrogenlyase subunit 3/multisubunit Na+/H+ antiporter MnhD subunit
MSARRAAILKLIAALIVAPIGAAVIIGALLLFGVPPQIVFIPGFFVMRQLEALGFTVANPVGVVSTVVFWWALILMAWSMAHKSRRS